MKYSREYEDVTEQAMSAADELWRRMRARYSQILQEHQDKTAAERLVITKDAFAEMTGVPVEHISIRDGKLVIDIPVTQHSFVVREVSGKP